MGWNADQWAQDVYDKLNTDLLAVALSFANEEGESRFSCMTNQRLSGQRLSLQALESLKADYAKQHREGFIPVALYTVSLGEEWQFRQNGLAKLFERHEDGYSMVCECALPLPPDAQLNEEVLSEIRRSEERLYEKKLRPLFRDAAKQRTVMEEIAALGGKVTYNQDASDDLPRVVFDVDGMVTEGRDVLKEIVNSGQSRLVEMVNKPTDLLSTPRSSAAKIGRNDPCPCGSGWKYKRCCGDDSLTTMLIDEVPSYSIDLPQELHETYEKLLATLSDPDMGKIDADNFAADPEVMGSGRLQDDIFKAGGMPPYQATWIETSRLEIVNKSSRVGILALHEQQRQGIRLTGFIESEMPEGKVLLPMVDFAFLALDDEWDIAPNEEIHSEGCDRRLTKFLEKTSFESFEAFAAHLALIVRVTFGMMNWDEQTVPRQTVKKKKPAPSPIISKAVPLPLPRIEFVPFFDVKVLDIAMLKRLSKGSLLRLTVQDDRESPRQHTVRASLHRVTRPLFGHPAIPGRTVGMIRVRAHRRGNPERGMISKTYRLKK